MKVNIKSLIIDDEPANHIVLQNLLGRHCPQVALCGNAFSAGEGRTLIETHRPELVFLDVKMPGANGFDMLRLIGDICFEVIFISGFDEYAIQAFEFNAVDYVLKPIDYTRLTAAVARAAERLQHKQDKQNTKIIHFIRSLNAPSDSIRKIYLHQQEKVHIVNLDEVVYLKSVQTYSEILTATGKKFLSAKPIGDYEQLLLSVNHFFRINRSMLINVDYVTNYTKGSNCFITLRHTDEEIEVSRRRKTAMLAVLSRLNNGF